MLEFQVLTFQFAGLWLLHTWWRNHLRDEPGWLFGLWVGLDASEDQVRRIRELWRRESSWLPWAVVAPAVAVLLIHLTLWTILAVAPCLWAGHQICIVRARRLARLLEKPRQGPPIVVVRATVPQREWFKVGVLLLPLLTAAAGYGQQEGVALQGICLLATGATVAGVGGLAHRHFRPIGPIEYRMQERRVWVSFGNDLLWIGAAGLALALFLVFAHVAPMTTYWLSTLAVAAMIILAHLGQRRFARHLHTFRVTSGPRPACMSDDRRLWWGGFIYCAHHDSRTWVDRLNMYGLSANYARPQAWLATILVYGFAVAIIIASSRW